ncbi:MAG: MFS transporter [Planctomycetota bacterium]
MSQLKNLPSSLLITQFLGAFNDNAWKLIIAILAMRSVSVGLGSAAEIEEAFFYRTTQTFIVFTIPLILFSIPAGFLADRLSKKRILVMMKFMEVLLMGAALGWLASGSTNFTTPLVILAAMGLQSALFSPAKYGILPEILPEERLSRANGVLELTTFLAIIFGTAAGGLLLGDSDAGPFRAGIVLFALGLLGFFFSFGIPPVPAAAASGDGDAFASMRTGWQSLRTDIRLQRAVLGSAFFWLLASLASQTVLVYAKTKLGLDDGLTGIPIAACGLGIGIGCFFAGRVSGERIEVGLVPLGFGLLGITAIAQGLLGPGLVLTLILMAALGFAGGLIVVPLDAFIQARAPKSAKGAVIALSNVLVFTATLVGSLLALGLSRWFEFSSQGLFAAAGVLSLVAFAVSRRKIPADFIRMFFVALGALLFKVRTRGFENIPEEGSALIVSNHLSYADWWLIGLAAKRPVRYIIDKSFYENKLFKKRLDEQGAIPIDARGRPADLLRSLREAGKALDDGDLVCIFAEGQICRTGTMQPLQRGIERMLKGRDVPVIPAHLDRLWGGFFAPSRGKALGRHHAGWRRKQTVSFGKALAANSSPALIRQKIEELESAAWIARNNEREALHRPFFRRARWHPLGESFADGTESFSKRIVDASAAFILARRLRKSLHRHDRLALLLPATRAAGIANLAASLSGRAVINLNPTVGPKALASAFKKAQVDQVLTTPMLLEKLNVELPSHVEAVDIAALFEEVSAVEKLTAILAVFALPASWLEKAAGADRGVKPNDLAAILFSSGSSGDPKGILLEHGHIGANLESISQSLPLSDKDRMLGSLPFFHAFGTMSFWLACSHGMPTAFTPNPLDGSAVAATVVEQKLTLLMATPTFLQIYLRRVPPGAFGSLRLVVAGAERLPQKLNVAFEQKFGTPVYEGYGATECSPVICVNSPNWRGAGILQVGWRTGSAGKPVPGVALRVVNPETLETVERGDDGLVLVQGPNLMRGYIGQAELSEEAFVDGGGQSAASRWYRSGDIGHRDELGFLFITDRMSRFSKIGGEMVPHGRVEEALIEAAGAEERILAVTALADEKKGERLVLIHTMNEADLAAMLKKATAAGLPNLFVPKPAHCLQVDELPLLGSGKLDLRGLKEVAQTRLEA